MSDARYRWVVLGVGAAGAGAFSALRMGLPSLGPAMRDTFDLSLTQVGFTFTALAVGIMLALVPWGMLTDRIGERPVLAGGLGLTALALVGAALAPTFPLFLAALFTAGAVGASATGASGRAIMGWFGRRQRGFALGIRQMALPLGGGLAALTLPALAGRSGLEAALLVLAGLSATAAVAAAVLMRDAPPADASRPAVTAPPPMRDRRIWRLGAGSALLVVAQASVLGFLVLFLHDEHGLRPEAAAAALATLQLSGAVGRIRAGRRSDREERRVQPIRRRALAAAVLLVATAVATAASAPLAVLLPVLLCAGVATMTWNGLAFTAAAELSGRERAGTAMSVQNTIVAVGGATAPAAFGALVESTAWPVGYAVLAFFPLAAFAVLRPLVGEEDGRAAARAERIARSATLPRAQGSPTAKEAAA